MSESNNENGTQSAWYGDVSADTISEIESNKWGGVDDVINAYTELKNKDVFKMPDNEDDLNSFYDKLGRPEKPEDYNFKIGQYDQDESYAAFKESAYNNGLTASQAEGLYRDGDALAKEHYSKMEAKVKEENEKTLGGLKQEWGKEFDDKMEGARKAFADMGLDENVAEDVGKLIGVANTVKLFDALANGSKEHLFLDDGGAVGLTKNAIEAEIYEITHKAEYMDDTKNKLLVERVTSLHKKLYPDK